MKIDQLTKKLLSLVVNYNDFTIQEIYSQLTEFRIQEDNDTIIIFCPNLQTINYEINKINAIVSELCEKGVFERHQNTKLKRKISIKNEKNTSEIYQSQIDMLDTYANFRFCITDEFFFFIKNNYKTKEEYEIYRKSILKEIKDWLPIIISVAALIFSSIPSWILILNKNPQKIEITQDNSKNLEIQEKYNELNTKLEKIYDKLEALEQSKQNIK